MADAVLLDVEDGIASIRLNRPDRLNVLSVEVSEGLRDAVESAVVRRFGARDRPVGRRAVLHGRGEI